MSDGNQPLAPMYYLPLGEGRVAIRDQARIRGVEIPVGKTVTEIAGLGFDVDPTWELDAVLVRSKDSPTGYAILNANMYAILTTTNFYLAN